MTTVMKSGFPVINCFYSFNPLLTHLTMTYKISHYMQPNVITTADEMTAYAVQAFNSKYTLFILSAVTGGS